MVQHFYIHQRKRLLQRLSQDLVRVARFRETRRMVMGEYYRCGIMMKGSFHHFARIYARLGKGPFEQFFRGDSPILCVEKNRLRRSHTSCPEE